MSNPKYSRMGPESDEYNRLKGQWVRIWPQGVINYRDAWYGRLLWVDAYTLGVSFDATDPANVSIVYKAGIRIDRISADAASDGAERDNSNHGNANKG